MRKHLSLKRVKMNSKFHRFFIFLVLAVLIFPTSSQGIKIVTWNILNFPGTTGEGRIEYFRQIVDELNPDILVVQEMLSVEGTTMFQKK